MTKQITQAKVKKLIDLQEKLKKIKGEEFKLRKEICNLVANFKTEAKTYRLVKKFGTLIARLKTNYSIDQEVLEAIHHKLSPQELDCIKYKPEVKVKSFKLLDPKSLLKKAVIEKPGAPTFEFKPPKER